MSKYTGKDFEEATLNKKRYWVSTGLNQPQKLDAEQLNKVIKGAKLIHTHTTKRNTGQENPYCVEFATYRVSKEQAGDTADHTTTKERREKRAWLRIAHSDTLNALRAKNEARRDIDEIYKIAGKPQTAYAEIFKRPDKRNGVPLKSADKNPCYANIYYTRTTKDGLVQSETTREGFSRQSRKGKLLQKRIIYAKCRKGTRWNERTFRSRNICEGPPGL